MAGDISQYLTTTITQPGVAEIGKLQNTLQQKSTYLKYALWFIGIIVLVVIVIIIYDLIAQRVGWPTVILTSSSTTSTEKPATSTTPTSSSQSITTTNNLAMSGSSSTENPDTETVVSSPPLITSVYNWFMSGSSGNLAPLFHDATTSVSISGSQAPLSAKNVGTYGIQWWMYVKDWNYGYGKDKSVLQRPDISNSNVINPNPLDCFV